MPGKAVAYWDTCIFIAWLKNEDRPDPLDLDGIDYLVELWDQRRLTIVTSTITRVEVLDSSLTADQRARFLACLEGSRMVIQGATSAVADVAHDLREFYASPRLETPDALHLATAIVTECEVFYTFDGTDKKDKKKCPLLELGPMLAGKHALRTEPPRRPSESQGRLPFRFKSKE